MRYKRHFLKRRRVDLWLLVLAFAATAVLNPAGKVLFFFFFFCGIYLAFGRHRAWRYAPPAYSAVLFGYCAWSIGLSFARGEPILGNRLLVYALIELAMVFVPLGLCLIRRPLDAMITGARIGVVLLVVATPVEYLITGARVGLGSNEAILAFIAAATGLMARLTAERPLRFMPNGRWWPYLALVPVALTQTRAAWFVYVGLVLLDLAGLLVERFGGRDRQGLAAPRRSARYARPALAGIAAAGLVALVPVVGIVDHRIAAGLEEIEEFQTTGAATGSVDVRLVMWSSGLKLLADHPFIGVGSTQRIEEVGARAGGNEAMVEYYTHLHNLFLDEALSSGLIGLALLLAVFATFLVTVLRSNGDRRLKETSALFLLLVFSFGSFHGVLLNEWMVIVIFAFMSVVLTSLRRREFARRRRVAMMGAKDGAP